MIRAYYQSQSFQCAPGSACCGAVGQAEWEMLELCTSLEQEFPGIEVELVKVLQGLSVENDLPVIKILNTPGTAAYPLGVLNGVAIPTGPPVMGELAASVREKLAASRSNEKDSETLC